MKNKTSRIKTDYKNSSIERPKVNHHWRLRWAALGLGSVVLGVVMAKTQPPGASVEEVLPQTAATEFRRVALELPAPAEQPAERVAETSERASAVAYWRALTVKSGDTFARLLRSAGIAGDTVHALASAGEAGRAMARIFPGDKVRLGFGSDDRLERLAYQASPARQVVFERDEEGFTGRVVEESLQRRLHYARGTIETSLFEAGAEAGLSDRLLMELVGIFGWDIDFVLDIRRGDRFTLIYESLHKDGRAVRTGDIVAAEFVNRGQVYRALRYTNPDGETSYYAPDGTSMRKAFLRSPVKFTRISSTFGRRYHPTLHRMRNHHGVDYAAPTGTPIRATGDGRIAYRGYNGGYGRMIVLRHGGRYSTAYAHMSRFAGGTAAGRYVEQGDVIGYVGSTGRSTGPHLHYEFRVNGVHKNPLTVEFPSVEPVAPAHAEHFRQQIADRIAQLDTLDRAYASIDPSADPGDF